MEIVILDTPADVGRVAAARIAAVVRDKPRAVLGLATGGSPLGLYAELAREVEAGNIDLSEVTFFALDEYVGLPADHPHQDAHRRHPQCQRPVLRQPGGGAAPLHHPGARDDPRRA